MLLSLTCLALNPSSSSGCLGSSWQSEDAVQFLWNQYLYQYQTPFYRRNVEAVSVLIKYSVFFCLISVEAFATAAEVGDDCTVCSEALLTYLLIHIKHVEMTGVSTLPVFATAATIQT